MADIRPVTPDFAVSPQLDVSDLAAAKARGFTRLINNRPDGESPDQADGAEIATAARAAGMAYAFIPVVGRPTADQAAAVADFAAGGRTLAFCRSGTRSITVWAMGELAAGRRSRDELIALAARTGYDLSAALTGA